MNPPVRFSLLPGKIVVLAGITNNKGPKTRCFSTGDDSQVETLTNGWG